MFEITIKGETLEALAKNVLIMAKQYQATVSYNEDDAAREAMQAARKGKTPPKTPAKEYTAADEEEGPVEPMPAGANAVVDAGTGRPVEQVVGEVVEDEPVKHMTMTDVKVAAAKLAASDTPKLAAILKKYNAAKLSEVSTEALGDFAGEVIEALG